MYIVYNNSSLFFLLHSSKEGFLGRVCVLGEETGPHARLHVLHREKSTLEGEGREGQRFSRMGAYFGDWDWDWDWDDVGMGMRNGWGGNEMGLKSQVIGVTDDLRIDEIPMTHVTCPHLMMALL